jgi:hypothetical protein
MNDAEMRELYAHGLRRAAPADRSECIDAETMLAIVERRLGEGQRLRALDHITGCDPCRRELELLRLADTTRPGLRLIPQYAAFAAAAVLAVALGAFLAARATRQASEMRGGSAAIVLVAPSAGATVDQPARFTWRAVPGATRYSFELLGADGTPAATESTADTALTVPTVAPGAYDWWVRTRLLDGGERRSALTRITVR